jgi:hypothetical protein
VRTRAKKALEFALERPIDFRVDGSPGERSQDVARLRVSLRPAP